MNQVEPLVAEVARVSTAQEPGGERGPVAEHLDALPARAPRAALLDATQELGHAEAGGVRFVPAAERACLAGRDALVVRVERLTAATSGALGEWIDDRIEEELLSRGAGAPGLIAARDRDDALSDQLFRMRRVGLRQLLLAIGSLRHLTPPRGALDASDSAALLFWARATRDRPVGLWLDEGDRALGAHVTPVPLGEAINALSAPRVAAPALSPREPEALTVREPKGEAIASPSREAHVAPAGQEEEEPPPVDRREARSRPPMPEPEPALAEPAALLDAPAAADPEPTVPMDVPAPAEPDPPAPPIDDGKWRAWAAELARAKGPQPLVAFERLFVHSYLPLCNAIAEGRGDARARQAYDEFRRAFAHVYAEACPAFPLTGKRPKMVFDAPDLALRIARLHGARTTQLLLVTGMRHDLGEHVKASLAHALGARGSLTDELLLWSALPTTTNRQLVTLARGCDALREEPASEREPEPPRGRTAETIRRVKTGSRDVYKLDLADARLRDAGAHPQDTFPSIGDAVADVVSRHAGTLSSRTLLLVFGDRGFTVGPTGEMQHGGATPEEVLVPAYAFLIADVH